MVEAVGVVGKSARMHQNQNQSVKMENKKLTKTAPNITSAVMELLLNNRALGDSDIMKMTRNVLLCSL